MQFAHEFKRKGIIQNFAFLGFGILPRKVDPACILSEKSIFLAS